ncbi:hypothetical protein KT71_002380 [Congregibacter litoralis KT71]|jgi:hypothetical protein|uniref:Uncharacterized protein n=1 Tax=Congregibacter litoralis KT71 TaxID=314285 RepID=V7HT78_9GAMM|nr:hypothetical protein KT71_002380 [Congregibacter litoralis KT71]
MNSDVSTPMILVRIPPRRALAIPCVSYSPGIHPIGSPDLQAVVIGKTRTTIAALYLHADCYSAVAAHLQTEEFFTIPIAQRTGSAVSSLEASNP